MTRDRMILKTLGRILICIVHLRLNAFPDSVFANCSSAVAYAGFFNEGGVSVTSHRDDVKILHYNSRSLEVYRIVMFPA